jgi:tRNA(fMet)-specific endonuclease VapC
VKLRYLLDTNVLSTLIRQPQGPLTERLAKVGEDAVCTSIVVAAELRYGAAKSQSHRLSERVHSVLSAIEVLPLESPVDRCYAEIRHQLATAGVPIGPNDLLIAAHAMAVDLTVVTRNVREFSRVTALRVEDWS